MKRSTLDSAVDRGCSVRMLWMQRVTKKHKCTRKVHRGFFVTPCGPNDPCNAPRATAESRFTNNLFLCSLLVLFLWFLSASSSHAKQVVVLGIDGMDPKLLEQYMSAGVMPNFSSFVERGDFKELQTSCSPQSPVAWSTFITGMDPGGHGIYDFVHRDPLTMAPFLSMSKAVPGKWNMNLGSLVVPLSQGKVKLLRDGPAFWQILGEHDIPTTIFRMPVNFPPVIAKHSKAISGMGTPDIRGTPGTFSLYTDRMPENADDFTGGEAYPVEVIDGRVDAKLYGPNNPFRRQRRDSETSAGKTSPSYHHPKCTFDFSVFVDPEARAAKFVVGQEEFILKEGEWSDWVPIDFEAIPWAATISSIGRFYVKQLEPDFELYVTPLQINPKKPVMPISDPPEWSNHLCGCLDYFYTQELPEDTKAFTHGVFSGKEFWDQVMYIHDENRTIFKDLLEDHSDGLLFFYFGTVDQGCHMLWHYMDDAHPGFVEDTFLRGGIQQLYEEMDAILGHVLDNTDEDTVVIVMSDHGFSPFYWGVNLNTWLLEKGYLQLRDPSKQGDFKYFGNVDWQQTKAYALGLNGVYLNLRGREKNGIVSIGEYERLLDQLESDLLAMVDPHNNQHPVTRITRPRRDFHGPHKDQGPDLLIGYNWGYRSSWESPLGEFPTEVFVENHQPWSGDHCIDHRQVPGVLIADQEISLSSPALQDLTVAILDEFDIPPLRDMIGQDCLGPTKKKRSPAEVQD